MPMMEITTRSSSRVKPLAPSPWEEGWGEGDRDGRQTTSFSISGIDIPIGNIEEAAFIASLPAQHVVFVCAGVRRALGIYHSIRPGRPHHNRPVIFKIIADAGVVFRIN